jgi:hypothetical protein
MTPEDRAVLICLMAEFYDDLKEKVDSAADEYMSTGRPIIDMYEAIRNCDVIAQARKIVGGEK